MSLFCTSEDSRFAARPYFDEYEIQCCVYEDTKLTDLHIDSISDNDDGEFIVKLPGPSDADAWRDLRLHVYFKGTDSARQGPASYISVSLYTDWSTKRQHIETLYDQHEQWKGTGSVSRRHAFKVGEWFDILDIPLNFSCVENATKVGFPLMGMQFGEFYLCVKLPPGGVAPEKFVFQRKAILLRSNDRQWAATMLKKGKGHEFYASTCKKNVITQEPNVEEKEEGVARKVVFKNILGDTTSATNFETLEYIAVLIRDSNGEVYRPDILDYNDFTFGPKSVGEMTLNLMPKYSTKYGFFFSGPSFVPAAERIVDGKGVQGGIGHTFFFFRFGPTCVPREQRSLPTRGENLEFSFTPLYCHSALGDFTLEVYASYTQRFLILGGVINRVRQFKTPEEEEEEALLADAEYEKTIKQNRATLKKAEEHIAQFSNKEEEQKNSGCTIS